jgi:uncharacterized protein YjbJ (UPF0337 family)
LTGKIKEVAGTITGSNALTTDGRLQQTEAKAQRAADAQAAAADAAAGLGTGGALEESAVTVEASAGPLRLDLAAEQSVSVSAHTGPRRPTAAANEFSLPVPRPAMKTPRPAAARRLSAAPTRTLARWAHISQLIRYGETRSALVRPRAEQRPYR